MEHPPVPVYHHSPFHTLKVSDIYENSLDAMLQQTK